MRTTHTRRHTPRGLAMRVAAIMPARLADGADRDRAGAGQAGARQTGSCPRGRRLAACQQDGQRRAAW